MAEPFNVLPEDILHGIQVGLDTWESPEGVEVNQASSLLVADGRLHALFVPAVKFVLDTTFGLLETKQDDLSRRVIDRFLVANNTAARIADFMTENGYFGELYASDPALQKWTTPTISKALHDREHLQSLSATPFFDAGRIAGGALDFLHDQDVVEEPASVIARSKEPLVYAGTEKSQAQGLEDFLGKPYVSTIHLRLEPGEQEPSLQFSDAAYDRIVACISPGHGCPAGKLPFRETTLLEEYWPQFVTTLVPADATL